MNMPMRPPLRHFWILLLAAIALIGCGGGGGSSSGDPLLRYTTNWSQMGSGNGVTGLSQRITLFNQSGGVAYQISINQDETGDQTTTLEGFAAGTYRLFVELFSQRDLGGVQTGEFEAIVTINNPKSFRSAVGVDPSTVKVSPPSATFPVQESRQFYATAFAGSNGAAFVAPNSFTWSQLGGHVTVNNQGIALAVSAGTGSVRATHTGSGAQNGATYTITPFSAENSKWTVLVYMNAANDLAPFSVLNMNQMEKVAQNDQVRFIVQWKQAYIPGISTSPTFQGTRRYLAKPDTTNAIASQLIQDMGEGVDMGSTQTLNEFIEWAQTYYPSDRTVLVVWNHGNGWRRRPGAEEWITRAVSYDDEFGTSIQIWNLAQGLGDNQFDILAWDASLMQMMEVAYEARGHADYVVGSEESPPGEGYPYDTIFQEFRDNPDASTLTLAKEFVDGMLAVPAYASRKITQSVIDTSKLPALATAISNLGTELIANQASLTSIIQNIRTTAQSYSPTSSRVYRDLIDVCLRLEAANTIQSVDDASAAVRAAAADAIVYEGHNANSAGSKGLAIDFSASDTFTSSAADYALLQFAIDTQWNEWLAVAP